MDEIRNEGEEEVIKTPKEEDETTENTEEESAE